MPAYPKNPTVTNSTEMRISSQAVPLVNAKHQFPQTEMTEPDVHAEVKAEGINHSRSD